MKDLAEIKQRKVPIVRVDESLNQYDDKILFPDKLEKANEMLRKVGLPKKLTTNEQLTKNTARKPTGASS